MFQTANIENDEFKVEDVGSTLLTELAQGLYQPHEVLREYIQNAVDAHKHYSINTGKRIDSPIQIEIEKQQIIIIDSGIGMDKQELKDVKAVGISKKGKVNSNRACQQTSNLCKGSDPCVNLPGTSIALSTDFFD